MDENSRTIQRRLAEDSDFLKIAAGIDATADLSNHFSAEVVPIRKAQPTSASVERSFLYRRKCYLCSGWSFDKNNARSCLIMRFNCSKSMITSSILRISCTVFKNETEKLGHILKSHFRKY